MSASASVRFEPDGAATVQSYVRLTASTDIRCCTYEDAAPILTVRDGAADITITNPGRGNRWQDNDLVFPSRVGTRADASHVRRAFRQVVAAAGLDPQGWTPRELRHSFVSLLSDADVPIERISRLVGHSGTTTTETIYRKQIRPVIVHGADVMDQIFPGEMNPGA